MIADGSLSRFGRALGNQRDKRLPQGMAIRGLSIAVAGGRSTASVPGATTTNFYFAKGNHSATGKNLSLAGVAVAHGNHLTVTTIFAGGTSSASAH